MSFAFLALLAPLAAPDAHGATGARADTVEMRAVEPAASLDSLRRASDGAEEFPATLATFTTTLSGSLPARTANVRLAAQALDGAVLEPGQVLSFNAVVGPRTRERGYEDAPVILHESRQVQTGGGVCQVASTVFVASLLAGLSPAERWRHSTPVDYIPLGEDATIAWGAKDLRVRNDLAQRVRLRVRVTGATLTASFEGEVAEASEWELATEERSLAADPGVTDARPGREIELYRVRRGRDGDEERAFLHRDVFPPSRGSRREEP